ncbi:MAG: BREX-4 system phosphatase PglZ [Lachnospiraceae bacterium]|nr:BREX-4 system phosphatase PglZ [Lachnospiraceae bacterium]
MGIGCIKEKIEMDLERNGSYDRFPVRFLSVRYDDKTSDTLIQLKKQLKDIELFDIKDLLPHEDAWITPQQLKSELDNLGSTKSFMVVGFSEYARFLSKEELNTLVISLLEIENSKNLKRRIYLICFALYSHISKVINMHHRIANYNPLLNEVDIEDLPHIFFIQDSLNVDNGSNEVKNSTEWFGMWRNSNIEPKKPIICSSKALNYFYEQASPDNVYNIQCLETYQDVLKYMYSVGNLHMYKKDPNGFCSKLIALINAGEGSVTDIILSKVNVQCINASNIYWLWKQNDIFMRWLMQNYVLIKFSDNVYLYKVMLSLEDLSDREFLEKMYGIIFEYRDVSLAEERKQILESIRKIEKDIDFSERMESYYKKIVTGIVCKKSTISVEINDFTLSNDSLTGKRDQLKEIIGVELVPYLTCFSKYERQLALRLYSVGLITADQIKNIYPNLWYYLNDVNKKLMPESFVEKCNQYFETYKRLRLTQLAAKEYNVELSKWNGDEDAFYGWYFNGQIEYPEIYLKKIGFKGNVYVLDGVGAEFLGFLLRLLEEKGYSTELSSYCKCHLPSITMVAKEYYPSEYKWISDYDTQVVHGEIYYHIQNVEKALRIIENLVEQIVSSEENEFAITADHGATAGHKIDKKDKKYNFKESQHDGRCYYDKDRQHLESSKDYVVYDDEAGRQWVISLNQQSLYNNSKYAVHGGATPEEILVPVIIAKKNEQGIIYYVVRPVNLNISGLNKSIMVEINPVPKNEKVYLKAKDGTDVEMTLDNNTDIWTGELERGIEQDLTISIGEQIYTFRTIPETKMGDDLFDD